jgi:hypothetical protein
MWADGLTPVFILGKIGSKLYYGVNDKYKLYISGMDDKDGAKDGARQVDKLIYCKSFPGMLYC